MLIQWHITERCNLRCSHCYQESAPPPEPPLSQLLAILDRIDAFTSFLRDRAKAPVPVHITITGGEPFLHPGFIPLIRRIAARPDRWTFAILSNGTLIDDAVIDVLADSKVSFVQVSIEGSEPVHDRIRGCGTFRLATRALGLLVAHGIPSHISFTAHQGNVAEFPAVAALARSLRVTRLWSDRMVPLGRGAHESSPCLSPEETLAFFTTMQEERMLHARSPTEIAMHRALQFLVGQGQPYRCTAGDTLLTILPDGSLCPCRRMPRCVGNVLEQPIHEIYMESPLLRALREPDAAPEACGRCFYSRLCRGGLRCLADAVHGTPFAADPGCWLAQG